MAESMLASLFRSLDKRSVSEIATALGASDQSVSRCMEMSIAAVLAGMTSKAEDPGSLRRMLDLTPGNSSEVTWPHLASSLSNPNSPLIAGGKQIVSSLFGTSGDAVTTGIGRECGLESSTVSTLMAMAAPMVMSFLSKRVRDEGISMTGLGTILQRESASIQNALPAGLSAMFWPHSPASETSPMVAQYDRRGTGVPSWIPALALCGLALGVFMLLSHARRPAGEFGSAVTGSASRMANEAARMGDFVKLKLPNHADLNIPVNGTESRLLVFVQDPRVAVDRTSWFDFDRLTFDSGSATLRPESREQLDNIAAILAAYPNVRINITASTDDVGSRERNLELSQARADSVKTALVARGVSVDRLTTQGIGEQTASGDNSESARARNRRAALQVTQK